MTTNIAFAMEPVLQLALHYKGWGKELTIEEWASLLRDEADELLGAVHGTHEHHPHLELMQIAAIAINCLALFGDIEDLMVLCHERIAQSTYRLEQ